MSGQAKVTSDTGVGTYLADDRESRLRALAPVQCRLCKHLITRTSVLLEAPEMRCGRPEGDDENARILGVILMRLAKRDECDLSQPFKALL